MEITELCLAPRRKYGVENGSSSESDNSFPGRKRKFFNETAPIQTSVDLHVSDPLPLDWEQCLDLESGRMYYLNRKTLRKSWSWPNKDQKLDLELNISVPISDHHRLHHHHHHHQIADHDFTNEKKVSSPSPSQSPSPSSSSSSCSNNMVALACLNCHLLVILSRSSPCCPNCKYVHSLPLITHQPPLPNKPLNTLSLLN